MTAQGVAPARQVLEAAQQANDRLGNENLGSLSYSHGFLPRVEPRRSLPPTYAAWDQIAADLPRLYRDYAVRRGPGVSDCAIDGIARATSSIAPSSCARAAN